MASLKLILSGILGGYLEMTAKTLGVLSHHLKCEMKSPHLVDFS